jgi:hypothetical protein
MVVLSAPKSSWVERMNRTRLDEEFRVPVRTTNFERIEQIQVDQIKFLGYCNPRGMRDKVQQEACMPVSDKYVLLYNFQ